MWIPYSGNIQHLKELRAKILYQGTDGTEKPTRASMPFHMALGASEAGHNPLISLAGDAAFCIQDLVVENVKGVGMQTLKEFFEKVLIAKISIDLCLRGLR